MTKPTGRNKLDIKGVTLKGKPIFADGPYSVFVGWIDEDTNKDIPHYLIVNTDQEVVEGASARLYDARGLCQAFSQQLKAQDELLAKNMNIAEPSEEQEDAVLEIVKEEGAKRSWKKH